MRRSRLWMAVGLLASALVSAAACTAPYGAAASDAGDAGISPEGSIADGADGGAADDADADADAANATDAPTDGRCAVTVSSDFSAGYGAAWAIPTSACATGGATFMDAGGLTCIDLTCGGSLYAYDVIVSQPLVLDDRMELAFEARIDGSLPHTFALLRVFPSGGDLGFAVAGTEIRAYDVAASTTTLASWGWSPTDPGFHHVLVQITRNADDAGAASALYAITLDGVLRSFKHPLDVSTPVELRLGPFLNFAASATPADDCYTNVTFGSCH